MKFLDKFIRQWRVKVAMNSIRGGPTGVFDIGCDDCYLLNLLDNGENRLGGCDPRLTTQAPSDRFKLFKGYFPSAVEGIDFCDTYDAIFALAVFEHFSEDDLIKSSQRISEMLTDNGRLIVTVPHPFVDKILDALVFFRLIEGQALEEHHGFDPESLVEILSKHLRLESKRTFQLGLNNIFVFKKI
ncbi:hypothetical protein [Hydrogenophaga sp. PAMC20947]|uniref:hypothetical protein n=1 Tax=Hydrogenophaga sp. PAMC20947 TaxID=2565558 RepID=UPI00109DA1CD|nr:hypothetical protein [Hydrogenophaga sp. PAMC20947]QCB46343.1 hypothetical protein E5678_10100 [Hydrogenophaga sp. PAMC20947]